jgi:aminoglycoside phosphotransferase (APT) family kinase protein
MDLDLVKLATDLSVRFPEANPIAPLRVLGSGMGNLVVETHSGAVFRIARDKETAARFNFERLLLEELAPHLPVSVPQPRWQASDLPDEPHGAMGYQKLDGVPLGSEVLEGERARTLGADVGKFLAALHAVSPSDLRTRVPVYDPKQIISKTFCASIREIVSARASTQETDAIDRWLIRAPTLFSNDSLVLCHSDLWYENVLVSGSFRLMGILDWGNASVAHPAQDFAALHYNGETYLKAACGAYADSTGKDATEVCFQSTAFLMLRELVGLQWAMRHRPEEISDAMAKVIALLMAA